MKTQMPAKRNAETVVSPSSSTRSSPRLAAMASPLPFGTINLLVPVDFDLPLLYTKSDPPTVAEALRLGAETYKTVFAIKSSGEAKLIQARHEAELHHIREAAAEKEQALAECITTVEQERDQLIAEHRAARAVGEQKIAQLMDSLQHQKSLAEQSRQSLVTTMSSEAAAALAAGRAEERARIQAQMDTTVAQLKEDMARGDARVAAKEAHIHALGEQQNALQVEREKEIKAAEQRGSRAAQALIDEKQATIERLEREKERISGLLESQIAANTTEVHQLGDVIRRRATNSSIKGRDFEEMMEHALHNSFRLCAGYELTRTANKGHEADFFTAFHEGRILWEFKNYETTVGSKEIAKLYRDVKDNPGTTIAVMISRYTPIVGHTGSGDMDIEFIDGVMYIYLSRFEFMGEDTLKSLWILFRLWWKNNNVINADESKQGLMRVITDLHERSVKAKSDWRKHKKAMEEGIKWMERTVDETEETLRTAIRALEGEKTEDVPAGFFNAPKNEMETELIQTIVGLTHVDAAGSIELNELAREVSKVKSISESTAYKHIKGVLLESVVESRSGKPTRVLGLIITHQSVAES